LLALDETVESDAETQWNEVIDRRSREMAEGRVDARSEEEVIRDIRSKLSIPVRKGLQCSVRTPQFSTDEA
jgi:hypothetical protein